MVVLLSIFMVVSLLGSTAVYFSRRTVANKIAVGLAVAFFVLACLILLFAYGSFGYGGRIVKLLEYPWLANQSVYSVRLAFIVDPLSCIMILLISLMLLVNTIYSVDYIGSGNPRYLSSRLRNIRRYHFWMIFYAFSLAGVVLAQNFLTLLWFWELATVCTWALISYYTIKAKASKASQKMIILNSLGDLFFIVAVLVLYSNAHSLEFSSISSLSSGLSSLVFILLFLGASAKCSMMPFFSWLADGAKISAPIGAFIQGVGLVKVAVIVFARILLSNQGSAGNTTSYLMLLMSLGTIIIAASLVIYQRDLRRVVTFVTITQVGYMMLGLSLYSRGIQEGIHAALLVLVGHAAAATLFILAVGYIGNRSGNTRKDAISGLYHRMPLAAISLLLGVISLIGLPPWGLFWGKLDLFAACLHYKGFIGIVSFIVIALETIWMMLVLLHIAHEIIFGKPPRSLRGSDEDQKQVAGEVFFIRIVLVILIFLNLVFSLLFLPLITKVRVIL